MATAEKVIVVCDEAYLKHTRGRADAKNAAFGRGTHAEWQRIETRLYEQQNKDGWLVPLLLNDGNRENVPDTLRAWQYEQVSTSTWHREGDDQFGSFWQRLHNTKKYSLPPASAARMPVDPAKVVTSR